MSGNGVEVKSGQNAWRAQLNSRAFNHSSVLCASEPINNATSQKPQVSRKSRLFNSAADHRRRQMSLVVEQVPTPSYHTTWIVSGLAPSQLGASEALNDRKTR